MGDKKCEENNSLWLLDSLGDKKYEENNSLWLLDSLETKEFEVMNKPSYIQSNIKLLLGSNIK